jgi:outer membrane protein assembly factor BamB
MARRLTGIAATLLMLVLPALAAADDAPPGDWPQWRGPTRDGNAAAGPKLLDAWPKEGPKLLWKSAPIPGMAEGGAPAGEAKDVGGCGSVSVADGKAFFFAHCQYARKGVILTANDLGEFGWVEGLTEDLAKKVDEAYRSPKRSKLAGADLDAYVKEFLATLDPADAKKFGDAVQASLTTRWEDRFSWGLLLRLSKMVDKEVPTQAEWNRQSGDLLHGHGEHAGDIRSVLGAGSCTFTDTIFCLDAADGRELWKKEFPGHPTGPATYAYNASSTPTVAGDRCYVTGSAAVYCLAVKDGAVVWQAKLAEMSNSSPLVVDGTAYVCTLQGLTAFDAAKGDVRWVRPEVRNHSSSAVAWTSGGKRYLLCNSYRKGAKISELVCLEPEKGAVLWHVMSTDYESFSTPALADDMAVVFGKGKLRVYKLSPEKAEKAWESQLAFDERGGSPLVYQGCVYTVGGGYGNSGAHCHDLKTGEMKWMQKLAHTEAASPIEVDGKIIAVVEADPLKTLMFRATPQEYEELGRAADKTDQPNRCASPAAAGGRLFLRMRNAIACYDLAAP